MRIIAGNFRGRKIAAPSGFSVRPTFDKVREALFSILMDDIYEATVLDLFAGSGSLGLEALSRGAKMVYFCDKSKESLKFINENIKVCKVSDRSKVFAGDFRTCISRIKEEINVVFLDPPYGEGLTLKAMEIISEEGILSEDGIICCELGKYEELPDDIGRFTLVKEKRYGNTFLKFYKNREG